MAPAFSVSPGTAKSSARQGRSEVTALEGCDGNLETRAGATAGAESRQRFSTSASGTANRWRFQSSSAIANGMAQSYGQLGNVAYLRGNYDARARLVP